MQRRYYQIAGKVIALPRQALRGSGRFGGIDINIYKQGQIQ